MWYEKIVAAKKKGEKLIAILLDPEKLNKTTFLETLIKIKESPATHILIGGSTYEGDLLDWMIKKCKEEINLPVFLFPGHINQISKEADAILFLSLISGDNPHYLIQSQIEAVPILENTALEVIATGYILIEGGKISAVEKVTQTKAISQLSEELIGNIAKAGEYLGLKLLYLEAGSGALNRVSNVIIEKVVKKTTVPIIVGGGISSKKEIEDVFLSGATMVVIGTAFENNPNFFNE